MSVQQQLKDLPSTPGVYRFFGIKKCSKSDFEHFLLYVGKAANLNNRVRSYFVASADLAPLKRQMVGLVQRIEWTETGSEIEALLLEANLIKKHQPKYNVLLRDDKSYQYIHVTTDEEWPRVLKTRTIGTSGTYFGPFTSGRAVVETLKVIRKLFPFRCNQKPFDPQTSPSPSPKRRGGRACFWYHIGLCPGTCVGKISKEDYHKRIKLITLFLEGRKNEVYRRVKKERGTEYIRYLDNILAHARILSVGDQYANDVRELQRALHLDRLPRRIEGYDIANLMGREATGAMVVFTDGEPDKSEYKRFKIKTVKGANDTAMLREVLTRRMKHMESQNHGIIESLWSKPDLIIIDGGKGQLNAALAVLKKMRIDILVIAVAKGGHGGVLKQKEEIYFPGEKKPLRLSRHAPALHLVLRIRDETHRFAIGYHKVLRKKWMFQ